MSEKNWKVRTSGSLYFIAYYEDDAGNAIDLTGYTSDMDVKEADGTMVEENNPAGTVVDITDAANGEITVQVNDLSAWPTGSLQYDLILINGSLKQPILWGEIEVAQGVTT